MVMRIRSRITKMLKPSVVARNHVRSTKGRYLSSSGKASGGNSVSKSNPSFSFLCQQFSSSPLRLFDTVIVKEIFLANALTFIVDLLSNGRLFEFKKLLCLT